MKPVQIRTEYITLGQLLKLCNCIDSGGQVKPFLLEHSVFVNRQAEQRRGKKLYPGDMIDIEGSGVFVITEQPV